MSDILSFADELLQSMEKVEGGNLAPFDVSFSDSVQNDNDTIVASTKDLLDDCISPSRYTNHRKSDEAKQLLVSSVPANTSSFEFNCQLHNKNVPIPVKEDKYIQAARKRLARDKESKQMKEDTALPFHPSCNQCNQESTLSNSANTENIRAINDKNHNNLHPKDIDKLAYSCFEMFMKDVKEFQERCIEISDTQVDQYIKDLDLKYVKLTLNLLPDTNATVSKVKMLITRFIDKCKKDSSTNTIQKLIDTLNSKGKHKPAEAKKRRNTWQCSLCLKKDLSVTLQTCITCGRSRGYRERDYAKDIRDPGPSREGKIFIAESNYVQKTTNLVEQNTSEEKKRRHYLFGKRDFEIDSRMQLKSDVSELLESIRDFTYHED